MHLTLTAKPPRKKVPHRIAIIAWLAVILVGWTFLARHEMQAGAAGSSPAHWPSASSIPRVADVPILLLFAHPRCPCTRASLEQLGEITRRYGDQAAIWIVFSIPAAAAATAEESGDTNGDDGWTSTDQYAAATRIANARILTDVDAAEARRFGAVTSGQTLMYSPSGELLFSGGITNSRGHAGTSLGQQALESLLRNETPAIRRTPVFGCSIY